MMNRDKMINKDLADKCWLQQEAIKALPPNLVESALKIDYDANHLTDGDEVINSESEIVIGKSSHDPRPLPIYASPPIKDFDFEKYVPKSSDDEDD